MHIIPMRLSTFTYTERLFVDAVDVVVVGAGAGGLATAVTAAHQGLSVLVLERAEV